MRREPAGVTLNNGAVTAAITDLGGTHFITAPITLNSNLLLTVANAGDAVSISGAIGGNGGLTTAGSGTVTLSAVNTYSGSTTVGNGFLVLKGGGQLPQTTALTIGASSELKFTSGFVLNTLAGLTVNSGGTVDLGSNGLAINFPSPASDPMTAIAAAIASGYNGGSWTGMGITSSLAAANPGIFSVGYADGNTDAGSIAGPNQVVVIYTLAGDATLAGSVGFSDLIVVAQHYGQTGWDWSGAT